MRMQMANQLGHDKSDQYQYQYQDADQTTKPGYQGLMTN